VNSYKIFPIHQIELYFF